MRIGFYVQIFESLGVEYLSACLKQAGHETLLFFDPKLGDDSFVLSKRLAHMLSVEDLLVARMASARLDIAAFPVMTDTFATALRVAGKLKEHCNTTTVFGGVHVTSVPERVLAHPEVDYIVVGEGEEAFTELAYALEHGKETARIPNAGSHCNGELLINPPRPLVEELDALPFPDTGLFWRNGSGYKSSCYNIVASRGCPMSCTFCCNPLMRKIYSGKGSWHRRRSVGNVMAELKQAVANYSFDRVNFWDDDLIDDIDWLEEFAPRYAREIGLPFFAWAHPRTTNKRSVALLEQAGCREISLGVQSTNEETRSHFLHRYETNEEILSAFNAVRGSSIFLSTQNILQLPGQSIQEAQEMARFYFEHPVDMAHVQLLRYYPRTEIVEIAKEQNMLNDEDINRFEEARQSRLLSVTQPEDIDAFLKVRNFVVLLGVLPRFLSAFLLRHNRYVHLPLTKTSHVFILLCGGVRRLFTTKRRFVMTYKLREYALHYLHFVSVKLKWKLAKWFV